MMNAPLRVVEALTRLKGVFLEAPATQLSFTEATQLSGLEPTTCQIILEALEETRFLERHNGLFIRRTGPDHLT
jgi:DNA-binding IclR family transcriptional regulator